MLCQLPVKSSDITRSKLRNWNKGTGRRWAIKEKSKWPQRIPVTDADMEAVRRTEQETRWQTMSLKEAFLTLRKAMGKVQPREGTDCLERK